MPTAATPSTPALGGSRWNTFPAAGTTLTARHFFTAIEPLLQGIVDDNALTSADSAVLEDQSARHSPSAPGRPPFRSSSARTAPRQRANWARRPR